MALFGGNKEVCPVCGKKIKGSVLIKIKDNVALCQDCSAKVNMDTDMIHQQTKEDIRAHLEYRQKNYEKFCRFQTTTGMKVGVSALYLDEPYKLWYCTKDKRDKNPPIFSYQEVVDVRYLENGEPVAAEDGKKGVLGGLFSEKKEPRMLHSMKIHVDLNNPYTKHVDIEAIAQNDGIKAGSIPYNSNRRTMDRMMELFTNMLRDQGVDAQGEGTQAKSEPQSASHSES